MPSDGKATARPESREIATFSGGNTGVFITDRGAVVVDPKLVNLGPTLPERIKTVTNKPVVTVRDRLRIPYVYQVVLEARRDMVDRGVRVVPAHMFLGALP